MLQIVSPKGQIFVGIERSDIHGFVLISWDEYSWIMTGIVEIDFCN
jgi:hypothetical protein